MKKALAKRIADILEKLGVVGVAMALYQKEAEPLYGLQRLSLSSVAY
ncbi:MAG: hypothetical protein IJD16_03345 [Desulfovibrio sp.]|nr:hypothetical protein [Desulfovibrio sp.]